VEAWQDGLLSSHDPVLKDGVVVDVQFHPRCRVWVKQVGQSIVFDIEEIFRRACND
jgi:hypothetical protein